MNGDLYSLYIHIPFCMHRCGYCDFNTYTGQDSHIPAYVEALCKEIQQVADSAGKRLCTPTIFFGGGTPSLLSIDAFSSILTTLRKNFNFEGDVEISIEANPGTVSEQYLAELHLLGINRLSFGMQSAQTGELALLERQHDTFDVIRAVEWARRAGFDNLSLDLIFGLPGQDMGHWQQTLAIALGLKPEHLSLYALTVEQGTPLFRWVNRGLVQPPDDDLAADQYEYASEFLTEAGFEQYEISNWASKSSSGDLMACRHNLQYWRNLPYLGFGAGAHGCAGGYRTANVMGIREFIACSRKEEHLEFPLGPAVKKQIRLDRQTEMEETMMVGLRLIQEGVLSKSFTDRFGVTMEQAFGKQISYLLKLGLIEWKNDRQALHLSKRGILLGNRVFREFVGNTGLKSP